MTLKEYIEQQRGEFEKRATRRERHYDNRCAACGSREDHSVDSSFTHQWDDGLEAVVQSDADFLESSLRTLAAEFEKLVPGEKEEAHEVHAEDCNGNDHGRNCAGYLDDRAVGHNYCREETLSNIRAFIGETK